MPRAPKPSVKPDTDGALAVSGVLRIRENALAITKGKAHLSAELTLTKTEPDTSVPLWR